jgi:hypothetical protein
MKPLLLLDFDRTLFHTDRFWADFSRCLCEFTGIDSSQIFLEYEEYVSSKDKLRYIDYDNLIRRNNINHQDIVKKYKHKLSSNDYMYEDAKRLIYDHQHLSESLDFGILTFGQELFQSFKISLCKELEHTKAYITLLPKSEFISLYLPGIKGILIDDKIGQNLPRNWTEVNINRKSQSNKPRKISREIYEINDLRQAIDMAKRVYF